MTPNFPGSFDFFNRWEGSANLKCHGSTLKVGDSLKSTTWDVYLLLIFTKQFFLNQVIELEVITS
jgi:hypothetical protein